MSFVSKIEIAFATGLLKWNRTIDEKDRVINVVFFAELPEKLIRNNVCSCRFKLFMEQIVRFRIDGGVQPILLIIKLNHGFINRNVIRAPSSFWL